MNECIIKTLSEHVGKKQMLEYVNASLNEQTTERNVQNKNHKLGGNKFMRAHMFNPGMFKSQRTTSVQYRYTHGNKNRVVLEFTNLHTRVCI